MRNARKLMMLAVAVVAAMACTGGSALAAPAVTIEGNGPCPAVTVTAHVASGGCLLEARSETNNPVELRGLFGAMFLCENHFLGRVDGSGKGWIYAQTLTDPTSEPNPCTVQPCKEPNGVPIEWRAELITETTMEANFCVTAPIVGTINCHLNGLTVTQASHTVGEVRSANAQGTHLFCEGSATNAVLGHWNVTSAAPGIIIS